MALTLDQLWKTIPKEIKDGKEYIRYREMDIPGLYIMRMADPKKCSLQEWVDAFRDSQQPDGSYMVSYKQFLAKEKYYNSKTPAHPPFDPAVIQEGFWKEKDLDRLYFGRIREETVLTDQDWETVKSRIRKEDGRLEVGKEFKKELAIILEKFPSAFRKRAFHQAELQSRGSSASFKKGLATEKSVAQRLKGLIHKRPR